MKLVLYLCFVFLLISSAYAGYYTITNFDEATTPINISENKYYNITFPANATIVNAELQIRYTNYKNYSVDAEDNYWFNTSITSSYLMFDENWGTQVVMIGTHGYSIENKTIIGNPSIYTNLNNYYRLTAVNNFTWFMYCINSSGLWQLYDNITNQVDIYRAMPLPLACQYNTTLQLIYNWEIPNGGWSGNFFESLIFYTVLYPYNVKIKSNDYLIFNNTNNLTSTNSSINLNLNGILQNCTRQKTICPINISAAAWAIAEISLNISVGGNLYFSIYNEQTNSLINQNFSLELLGDEFSKNITLSNGIGNITGVPDGYYEIRYWNSNYEKRSYFLSMINATISTLQLYDIDKNISVARSFIIEDETGNKLENATLKLLRGFIENDQQIFRIVEMDKSNFEGTAVVSIDPDAKYKIIVEYEGTTIFTTQFDNKLTEALYTIIGITMMDTTEGFFTARNVYSQINVTQDNTSIFCVINDPSNSLTEFCLEVGTADKLLCDSCLSGSTGQVSCNVSSYTTQDIELFARCQIVSADYSEYIEIKTFSFNGEVRGTMGAMGAFFSILIVLTFVFVGYVLARILGGIFGLDLGLIFVYLIKLLDINIGLLIGIICISLVVAKLVSE